MTREEKIEYMLNDLAQRGVPKYMAAPPHYRVLWRLGLDVTPPPFATLWSNALFPGVYFAVGWGVLTWLMVWRDQPLVFTIIGSVVAGAGFGFVMAALNRRHWQKLRLPRWEDYPAAPP